MNIARGSVIGLAGIVGAGVLAWPMMSAASGDAEQVYKRDEQNQELVAVDDQDDDDTNGTNATNTRDKNTRADSPRDITRADNTRDSTRADNTRDSTRADNTRDNTRGDNTRDSTRGDDTRDNTQHNTRDDR